ncbi:MAG: YidC/Oxa1 family membrane protein insertase [Eubacteriales bacterium]|nr:YidC/Oxa1 family membrane protein insertase [Eubacteriales bacterium]
MFNAIIDPIATLLGMIFDLLFKGLNFLNIGNVAIAIIIFTIIVKICMLPLSIKQQKLSKLNSVMSPEIKAIQEKYKDKKNDQNAVVKMQEETKAVYEKYGVSQMGGCIQMLIQMPILFALYQVFRNIPLYISQIKVLFTSFLSGDSGIMNTEGYVDTMNNTFGNSVDWSNLDSAIIAINNFTADQWNQLKEAFPSFSGIMTDSYDKLTHMNTFLGVNMSQMPKFALTISVLIPILSGLTQFISVKVAQTGTMNDDDNNPMASSMKMTMYIMPLMSAFIAFSVPAGLGVYWIATAVIQTIITLIINRYYDKLGADEIVKKNIEKRNKKRAKKGLPPETIVKNAKTSTKSINSESAKRKSLQQIKEENEQKVKEIRESAKNNGKYKTGSLAEKAGMVAQYNERVNNKSNKKN